MLWATFDGLQANFGQVSNSDLVNAVGPLHWSNNREHMSFSDGSLRLRLQPSSRGSSAPALAARIPEADEAWLSYDVFPEQGWVPVRGGKLPGLAGGAANTGGDKPNNGEGFSARTMWVEGAGLIQYVYHQDQPRQWGEAFPYAGVTLRAGQWTNITHHVTMNDPGRSNGRIDAYINGQRVQRIEGLRLRGQGRTFGIDRLLLVSFFGGSDSSWSPPRTTYIRFDNVEVRVPGS